MNKGNWNKWNSIKTIHTFIASLEFRKFKSIYGIDIETKEYKK